MSSDDEVHVTRRWEEGERERRVRRIGGRERGTEYETGFGAWRFGSSSRVKGRGVGSRSRGNGPSCRSLTPATSPRHLSLPLSQIQNSRMGAAHQSRLLPPPAGNMIAGQRSPHPTRNSAAPGLPLTPTSPDPDHDDYSSSPPPPLPTPLSSSERCPSLEPHR